MSKLPAFQFYPGDWMKDPNLRRCSPAARGVWIDLLCLMFECEERGVLISGGVPWSREDVSAAIGGPDGATLMLLDELLTKGVARIDQRGAIFSARMARDEQERQATRARVKKHRHKGDGSNGNVTPMKRRSNAHSSHTPNGVSSSSTSPSTTHTHTARSEVAHSPPKEPPSAGVCVSCRREKCSCYKSKHGREDVRLYAVAHGLGGGWVTEACRTAEWDGDIDRFLQNGGQVVEQPKRKNGFAAVLEKLQNECGDAATETPAVGTSGGT